MIKFRPEVYRSKGIPKVGVNFVVTAYAFLGALSPSVGGTL
jgi:hypothetical protein